MEELSIADRFKVVLELINKIPDFDGNPNYLINFISRIEALIPILEPFDASSLSILWGYAKDKIVGAARCELQKHGSLNLWIDIRRVLINSFGEKNSINSLIDKIRTSRIKTNIHDLYDYINNILSRINNSLLLKGESDVDILNSNKRIALESFKHNLPEPTKTIVLCRDPKTIEEAYGIVVTLGHQNYGSNASRMFSQSLRQENFNSALNYRQNNIAPFFRNSRNNYQNRDLSFRNNFSNSRNNNTGFNNNDLSFQSNAQNNQTRQNNFSRQNTNFSPQYTQNSSRSNQITNNNFTQSTQSRRQNRNRPQNDNHYEPMDISLNESEIRRNHNSNFSNRAQNNYPI